MADFLFMYPAIVQVPGLGGSLLSPSAFLLYICITNKWIGRDKGITHFMLKQTSVITVSLSGHF